MLSVASYAAAAATAAAAVAVAVDAGVRRTDESAACGGGGAAGAGPVPSTLAPCESMPCLVFQKKRFFSIGYVESDALAELAPTCWWPTAWRSRCS